MADEGFERKLAAILSADVEGYSRLMDDDEEATVRTLTSYRSAISDLVQQYRGRVVDSPGDNILAEFKSVVDAVNCAVEIQRDLEERNAELTDTRKMQFRIGVNLGDVIEEDGRIYGDGVNIAARVEGLSEAGGICITGRVYDQVKNKLELGYEYLGEHSVKNISEPVRVYKVLMEPEAVGKVIGEKRFLGGFSRRTALAALIILIIIAGGLIGWNIFLHQSKKVEPASLDKMAYPLPEKPSIAVLPFNNLSDDPEQEYFSDGITENIITALSKTPHMMVIARNSVFTYKDKPVKIREVSESLGVQYVVEGSVQRSENRVRITVQLIDALKGVHMWAERYDRELKEIFALQDEITLRIINALQVKLTAGDQIRWGEKYGENIGIYEKVNQAIYLGWRATREDNLKARQLMEEALLINPEIPIIYTTLGWAHWQNARFGWSNNPKESFAKAFKYGQKSIALDDSHEYGHALLGAVYLVMRRYDLAIHSAKRAVELNPNSADSHYFLAGILCCSGRHAESIPLFKRAIRLNPIPPTWYFTWLGRSYRMIEDYDNAVSVLQRAQKQDPNFILSYIQLCATHSLMGNQKDAAVTAEKILQLNPNFSLERYTKTLPYKNKADIEIEINALRNAGLPD